MGKQKEFLVSTADFAAYYDDVLVATGTTNLDASISVSMDEQEVNGGKGNKLLYSFKYNRQLEVTLESADWKPEFLAMNVGSKIAEGATDVYAIAECVNIVNGIGILAKTPVDGKDVAVEFDNGSIVTVTPTNNTIDITSYMTNGTVNATYQYSTVAKTITIDSESTPMVLRLVLNADRHSNKLGKIGHIEIVVPSYQLGGSFDISFTPDGISSINLDGKALAVEGETCDDGSAVYAYVHQFDDTAKAISGVTEIVASPADIALDTTTNTTADISVIGIKGIMYSNVELANADCTFVSDTPANATVDADGKVTAVAAGSAKITVTYGELTDEVNVVVS